MIISKQNALIKEIRSLSDKKYRDRLNKYVVEGVKSVNEAIFTGQNIDCVIGVAEVLQRVKTDGLRVEEVPKEIFSYISEEVTPQGALAVVKKPDFSPKSPIGSCVFLDGVSDPSNVGAIIRTAIAAGYKDVYLADCADPFNGKAVRASMGGVFRANLHIGTKQSLAELINYPIVIADMGGEDVFKTQPNGKYCLVIGNEANGVSEFMRNKATITVKIPMENNMESLNAAVSAGIIMYALKNKL